MNLVTVTGRLASYETKTSASGNSYGKGVLLTVAQNKEEEWKFFAFGQAVDQLMGFGQDEPVCLIGDLQMYDDTSPYPRPTFRVRAAIGIPREEVKKYKQRRKTDQAFEEAAEAVHEASEQNVSMDPDDPNFDPFA